MKVGALLAATLVLTACGAHHARLTAAGSATSPESIARAWSLALDRDDNAAAGALFAKGAVVVQDLPLRLATRSEAVHWNAELPCGGRIISVIVQNATDVLVVFDLDERPGHVCDAPGQRAAALFRVRNGKIVLWHQTKPPPPSSPGGGGNVI